MSREGPLDRLIGQILAGRYRICECLGSGAFGTVFRAEHVKVGRKLAVKVLHPRMLEHEKYRRRFDREAELAGRLHHPNVTGALDVGITPQGLRYLVMEYADGPTLADLLDEGPMAQPRMMRLTRQLCDGLHHAHEHGLVHRDLKPGNVIVERNQHGEETPRILDFGIAIALCDLSAGERERLTTEGMVLGTLCYMAPEHASGQRIDHRIDLFALGVICYEMLTGAMPFAGSDLDIARAYLSSPIPPMKDWAPQLEIDPLLEAFTRALLARSPKDRPPSAKAARDLLDLIGRDRAAAAQQLGVKLASQRPTLPLSPAPAPAPAPLVRAPSGTKPPPAVWSLLPTEKMAPEPEALARGRGSAASPASEAGNEAAGEPGGEAVAETAAEAAVARITLQPEEYEAPARRHPWRLAAAPWLAAAIAGVGLAVLGVRLLRRDGAPAAPAAAAMPEAEAQARAQTPATAPALRATPAIAPMPAAAAPTSPTAPSAEPPAPAITVALPRATAPAPAAPPPLPAPAAPVPHAPPAAPAPPTRPEEQPPAAPPVAEPAAIAQAETPRADPPASAVADLYGAVGRSLKRLDELHGQEATFDLWPRFRVIHIFEALRTREGRVATHDALRNLEREIARRSQ